MNLISLTIQKFTIHLELLQVDFNSEERQNYFFLIEKI